MAVDGSPVGAALGDVATVGAFVGPVGASLGASVGCVVGAREGGVNSTLCTLCTVTPSPERYSAAASEPSSAPSCSRATSPSTAASIDTASPSRSDSAAFISTDTRILVLSSSNDRIATSRRRPWRRRSLLCATCLLLSWTSALRTFNTRHAPCGRFADDATASPNDVAFNTLEETSCSKISRYTGKYKVGLRLGANVGTEGLALGNDVGLVLGR